MVNKEAILKDLRERKLTQGQIAEKHNCSRVTVVRFVREHRLGLGRGVKNYWQFSKSSDALAYVIGAYITDGTVTRSYKTGKPRGFTLSSSTDEFVQHIFLCLETLGLSPSRGIHHNPHRLGRVDLFTVSTYSSMFGAWLLEICQGKSQIPTFLLSAPLPHRITFLAGAIDGDGCVDKEGSIRIRGVDNWLLQLPDFLECCSISTTGIKLDRVLDSGKAYWRVGINRSDYLSQGGFCIIRFKQQRLLQPEGRTNPRKRKLYPCRVCGNATVHRKGGRCTTCYRKTDEFHDHLVRIAPVGNKAGNIARWGKK